MRTALEAQMKRLRVEEVLLSAVADLVNLGMRRVGVVSGTEDERDLAQAKVAIEAVRALSPVLDEAVPEQARPVRDALAQVQMAFVQAGGSQGDEGPGEGEGEGPAAGPASDAGGSPGDVPAPDASPGKPAAGGEGEQEPGPAQRSGRLWVPGQ